MIDFIQKNMQYPEEALKQHVEGTVQLEYIINGLGKVIETQVLEGIGHGCDEEAVRLVESLVFEKVYNKGLNTRTKRRIAIRFNLPSNKPMQLKYQVVKKKEPESPVKQQTTYQIKVNFRSRED